MKKYIVLVLALITASIYAASTFTTHYTLEKPADGDSNWGSSYRDNMDTIDTELNANATDIADHLADTVDAHDASAISTTVGTLCSTDTTVQDFLDCLDTQLNAITGGTVVTTNTAQTITGQKTFTQAILGNLTGNVTGNVTGDLTGNVTGNVTGDLTGNVTGNVTGDLTGNVTGNVTGNADTATALAANPTDCSAGEFASSIDASGNLTCVAPNTVGYVVGPGSSTDNAIARYDSTTGKIIQNSSTSTIDDNGRLTLNATTPSASNLATLKITNQNAGAGATALYGIDVTLFDNVGAGTGDYAGIYIRPPSMTFGGVGNYAGLRIASDSVGGSSGYDNALRIDSGSSYFGGNIQMKESGGSDTITLAAPSVASSFTLTLPNTDGDANQALITDGSGNLSWAAAGGWTMYSNENISASGSISSSNTVGQQYRRVSGNGGAVVASTTPFGTGGAWNDGTVIRLVGGSSTNTVEIQHNDASNGAILNGNVVLGQYDVLELQWDATASRWIEISRSIK